ncbi:uroporphyrinogen-III synthase, partial [Candidatus Aerophobetes bacterium]|nr:uroporphyrinogen-III synthase [Candidatus Aerophobetes bacterium]
WIVFTSSFAVDFFWDKLKVREKDSHYPEGLKIAAIGENTKDRLKQKGVKVDLVPEKYSTRGLVEKLSERNLKGKRFLLPCSSMADSFLSEELKKREAEVDKVRLYTNELPPVSSLRIRDIQDEFCNQKIDFTTFTSGSTLINFVKLLGKDVLTKTMLACIGEPTAKRAREMGLNVDIVAPRHTFEGLVEAIKNYHA